MTFPTRSELLDSSGVDWGGKKKENKTWQQKIFDSHDHVTVDHCHMKGHKTTSNEMFCFNLLHLVWNDQTLDKWLSTILLILRPLSSPNSPWAGPTPNEQLDSFFSSPPLLRQRCNQWAPSSREERRVLIIKEQTCNSYKISGKGPGRDSNLQRLKKEKERIYIYKYKD